MSEKGKPTKTIRFPTAHDQSHFFSTLIQEIRANFPTKDITTISIAIPGPVENDKTLWLGNLPWSNFDIVKELKNLFCVPVFLENDANLGGLGEAATLKGLSAYLTFSTGIGGGVIRDGQIDPTLSNYEPGHEKYPWGNQITEWEDFASAHAIAENYGKLTSEITNRKDWREIANRLAVGIASTIASIHPDTIIIGGPLSKKFRRYSRYLKNRLKSTLSPGLKLPKIIPAKHSDQAVIYGAYIYAKTRLSNQ
jgi:predicted NBD/HSP70 family sugar kinase